MALRISAVPFLVSVTMLVATLAPGFGSDDASAGSLSPIAGLFFIAIFTAATLWMAVAWHRYVLAEDMRGLGPAFHGARMAAYLFKSLAITAIMILAATPVALVLFAIMLFVESDPAMVGFLVPVPAAVILLGGFLRLGTMLPGVAMRAGVPLMAGWKATSGQMWCFLQLGAMWVVLGWATDTITSALISTNMVIGFVWSVLELWVLSLMGPALLTTLYGHYIEGRPLN